MYYFMFPHDGKRSNAGFYKVLLTKFQTLCVEYINGHLVS
jgi:hypothetical protein